MDGSTPFDGLTDATFKYTVREVADKLGLTPYTVRYYDNSGLIPEVGRSGGNVRLFSDRSLAWLKLVHCLRTTGLSIEDVRRYVDLCLAGDSTIPERAELIFRQEKILQARLEELERQMEVLRFKKRYYEDLLAAGGSDRCNPRNLPRKNEPDILPR